MAPHDAIRLSEMALAQTESALSFAGRLEAAKRALGGHQHPQKTLVERSLLDYSPRPRKGHDSTDTP